MNTGIEGRWVERTSPGEGIAGDRGLVVRIGGKQGTSLLVIREHTGLLEWWAIDALETQGGRPVYAVDVPDCETPREVSTDF